MDNYKYHTCRELSFKPEIALLYQRSRGPLQLLDSIARRRYGMKSAMVLLIVLPESSRDARLFIAIIAESVSYNSIRVYSTVM